jgi:hypothetical protein
VSGARNDLYTGGVVIYIYYMKKNNDITARLIVTAGLMASVVLLEIAGFAKCVKRQAKKVKACCSNEKNVSERGEHVWF